MGDYGDLHYDNLLSCQVKLVGSAASSQPPVRLPDEIIKAVAAPTRLGKAYDFTLGTYEAAIDSDLMHCRNKTSHNSVSFFFLDVYTSLLRPETNVIKKAAERENDRIPSPKSG